MKTYHLTPRQIAYLDELSFGPAAWYWNDVSARGLTRRGLARFVPCAFDLKFVITDKGRDCLRRFTDLEVKEARAIADEQDRLRPSPAC